MLEPTNNTDTEIGDTVSLEEIYEEYQRDEAFKHLRAQYGVNFVPGSGPMQPDLMLIGEAPGRMENAKRIPFVGDAGTILNDILSIINIDPSTVFMTNSIKYWTQEPDHPGKTRPPTKEELAASRKYLLDEIEAVDPLIVGICGRSALKALYPEKTGIYKWRGQLLDDAYVVLYHPSVIAYSPEKRPLVLSTYFKLKEYLEEAKNDSD